MKPKLFRLVPATALAATNSATLSLPPPSTGSLRFVIDSGVTLTFSGQVNGESSALTSSGGAINVNVPVAGEGGPSPLLFGNPGNVVFVNNRSVNGGGGAVGAFFAGTGQHSVFDFRGLESITFTDNIAGTSGYGDGGGIYSYSSSSSSSVTLGAGASFTGNIARGSGNGGGIYSSSFSSSSSVTLGAGASFTGNIAGYDGYGYGGGIYSRSTSSSSSVELGSHAIFKDNTAGSTSNGYGGGIYSQSSSFSSVDIGSNAIFKDNTAGKSGNGSGGGIYSQSSSSSSSVTLGSGASFTGNTAGNVGGGSGGGIYSYSSSSSSSVELGAGANFTGNTAGNVGGGSGGGIYSQSSSSSSVTLESGASFTGNTAGNAGTGSGGGIYSQSSSSSSVTLGAGASFTGNIAGKGGVGGGGGIYSSSSSSSSVKLGAGANFTGNIAGNGGESKGGGIYSSSDLSSSVELGSNAVFKDNIVGKSGIGHGGGIFSQSTTTTTTTTSSSSVTLGSGANFTGNIAGYGGYGSGGGIYSRSLSSSSSTVTLGSGAIFKDNIAAKKGTGYGGGIYSSSFSSSSSVTLGAGASFIGNIAGESGIGSGGGIWVYSYSSSASVTLGSGAFFANNRAGGDDKGGDGGGISFFSLSGSTQTATARLSLQGHSYFQGNMVSRNASDSEYSHGGAIYFKKGEISLDTGLYENGKATGQYGPIAFSGNKVNVTTTGGKVGKGGDPNSIHLDGNARLTLKGDGNIYFDDPISGRRDNNSLNKSGSGFVQFVGHSVLNPRGEKGGAVLVSGGVFRVVRGASFTTQGTKAGFTVEKGASLAGSGSITAQKGFVISGTLSPDADRFAIPEFVFRGHPAATATRYNYFKPGRSEIAANKKIGTLTLNGNLVMKPGSRYEVEVDPKSTRSDKIVVTGKARLAGTLQHLLGGDKEKDYTDLNASYTVLEAQGGVQGTLALNSDLVLVRPRLTYEADRVLLSFGSPKSFSDYAATSNQKNVALALESLHTSGALYKALKGVTESAMQRTLDALSGEIHSSLAGNLFQLDSGFGRAFAGHQSRQSLFAGPGFLPSLPAPAQEPGYGDGSFTTAGGGEPYPSNQAPANLAWVQVGGSHTSLDSTGNAGRSTLYGPEVSGGYDRRFANGWFGGLGFRYSYKDMELDSRNSDADIHSYTAALYGGKELYCGPGALRFTATGAFTYHDIENERNVRIGESKQGLTGDYNAKSWLLSLEAAYRTPAGEQLFLEPFVSGTWNNLYVGSLTESGGSAALHKGGKSYNHGFSSLGLRAYLPMHERFSLNAELAWQHTIGRLTPESRFTFKEGSAPFTVRGNTLSRDELALGLGGQLNLTQNTSLSLNYNANFGDRGQTHGGAATFTIVW